MRDNLLAGDFWFVGNTARIQKLYNTTNPRALAHTRNNTESRPEDVHMSSTPGHKMRCESKAREHTHLSVQPEKSNKSSRKGSAPEGQGHSAFVAHDEKLASVRQTCRTTPAMEQVESVSNAARGVRQAHPTAHDFSCMSRRNFKFNLEGQNCRSRA